MPSKNYSVNTNKKCLERGKIVFCDKYLKYFDVELHPKSCKEMGCTRKKDDKTDKK